ncbi:MAG: hypothetical protein RBS17_01390 [Coriobacteriia bacterium]|nr:hypothetical protein [Coriobacteriia bacterium]
MMGALIRHRGLVHRAAAWLALASIAALLVLPTVALAESLLVSEYKVPKEAAPGDDHSDGWYITDENSLGEPVFHAGAARGADGSNGLDWSGSLGIDARIVGRGYRTDQYYSAFTSFEDFMARSSQIPPNEDYLYRPVDDPSLRGWSGAQRTTLGGLDAYVNRSSVRLEYDNGVGDAEYGESWVYWIPAGDDSGILVVAHASVWWSEAPPAMGEHHGAELDPLVAEVESVLASLRFHPIDGTAAGTGAPGTGGGSTSPWRTVGAGIAAVAAAAVALAGAAASTRAKTGDEEPSPDQPVGYILQLSTRSLQVSAEHSAAFTAQAFKVLANGSYQPAADAAIVLHPPAGVSVRPQTAYGTLSTVVWQTDAIAMGSTINVEARSALGMATTTVAVAAAGESRIVTHIEPAGTLALRTQGEHSITLIAAVELLGTDATDTALDTASIRASIGFAEDSEWLEISEAIDYEDGRAITVMASQPDPTNPVQPPESATVRVSAWLGERPLTELVTIPLAGLPEIDAKPDSVSLAAESGTSAEIAITIINAGDTPWQFNTEWREGSRAIATPSIEPTGPAAATLTLTEDGSENLDPTRPQTASTLVVVATAEGYDELRRHVDVIVTQEGLFVDRTNVDPSTGAFPLAADGSARPTAIDLRVFVLDLATGDISPDIGLAAQAILEIGGQEGTSGYAGLHVAGLTVESAGTRPLNIPSATFNASLERKLPTAGEPVPAALRASIAGYDADRFSALVPLRLLGIDMEPFSAAWEVERDNCLDIIQNYVPFEHQERLYALVTERSRTMGAEGLFYMRKKIWDFAYDQLMKEKHEHLDAAWWYQLIEDTLDWVSWCGDIAFGVASGSYLGVVGSMAIGMLKPLLVSAMEIWLAGGSLDDWLVAQTSTITDMLEGAVTDPDFLTRLSGKGKAMGYALFIAYFFAKELYNDPDLSVTNAMNNVGRQLRDEGLIAFLKWAASKRGITLSSLRGKGAVGVDAGAPKAATPDTPHTRTPGAAPDAPRTNTPATTPDAPRTRTPAAGDAPAPSTPTTTPDDGSPDAPRTRTPGSDVDTGARPRTGVPDTETPPRDRTPETEASEPMKKPAQAGADAETKPEQKLERPAPEKAPDADPRSTSSDPTARAEAIANDLKQKAGTFGEVDPSTVERIMRDPDAMRELRKSHPDLWKKVTSTRAKIYAGHDAKLKSWIEQNVPDAKGREIEIRNVGTPDGVDRDYRAGYVVNDPATGDQRFIELKKETWVAESQKIFAGETGGPTDSGGAAKWAKDHQQLGSDQYHAEASVDMADQATVFNESTGKWEKTQVTPNIDLVKDGRSTLIDPEGYGKTYETKVMEAYAEGNTLDAYKQAGKATHSLEGVRAGYAKQDYEIKHLPPEIREGMRTIEDVEAGRIKPAEAEVRLKEAGYTGGLPDFMEKVSGQFAGFKWARQK